MGAVCLGRVYSYWYKIRQEVMELSPEVDQPNIPLPFLLMASYPCIPECSAIVVVFEVDVIYSGRRLVRFGKQLEIICTC